MSIFESETQRTASIVALFAAVAFAGSALLFGDKDNARESMERAVEQINIWDLD